MGIRVALHHETSYAYDREVALSAQIVRLRPAPHCRTSILSYAMKVVPEEHFVNWQQDPFSNYLARLVFPKRTREFRVEIDLVAEMIIINPFDFFLDPHAETFPFRYDATLEKDLRPYLREGEAGPRFEALLSEIDRAPKPTVPFLVDINRTLQRKIRYLVRMEPNVQGCEETLALGSGSCRDSAWLLVQLLRHLGLAARFVSGYLIQLAPDVKSLDGPSGPEQDFTDLHAWTEVYVPGAGWIGLDPTSGLFAGEGHIPLACSPEPQSAAPVTGAVETCEVDFRHEMRVVRIHEEPRATQPYPEETWQEILELGCRVDEELEAQDVRLTMGGEPTFVSIDDMEGAEWNTDAVGPAKRRLAEDLLKRLRARWAPGGIVHHGQGKWYPGESLPRWALACYWREDGQPIWTDDSLLADEDRDDGCRAEDARRFIETLAIVLGVGTQHIRPAYEDVFYFLWKERRLPVNVDPSDSRLADPEERERLTRVFEQGLGSVAGYVLPIERGSWRSGPWPFRGDHMFLIPGDSPVGLRLPLDALPREDPQALAGVIPLDPMAPRGSLPDMRQARRPAERPAGTAPGPPPAGPGEPAGDASPGNVVAARGMVRTALCVQPRDGRLHVFLPPLASADDFIELVAAVEESARRTSVPVRLEGYPPPFDERLRSFKITPDPGVIEVNVQPAPTWDDLVRITTELYEEARQARLGTEKFLLDGRHTGTGGGNHIIIGAARPADSPFLRRPDLLRSFLAYFNNHPSLSYLFSGLFIGPTSQRPRVDEARHDSLYELEVAFHELDRQVGETGACPPWLVDRLFRHLLVDVTGNTHRTEFCIDKLFSPETASGRLGLVEFRAFEMPPHARMSLAQQLLLRVFVAWFWRRPYRRALVGWGTRLHDAFMLPHFVEADFADVLTTLNEAGYPFRLEHFLPHFHFRFPVYGAVTCRDIRVELRHAIEPWHVLGEEPGGGGTARYVDSSLERLQVKVRGMTDTRHIVLCNGRRVPLRPTGEPGTCVAGVRYRAWQPPACLHPTIPVHTPLVFNLVDTWSKRSIGGCTYHVGHPGGRNYEVFPVNANEAEGRRISRFSPMGPPPDALDTLPPPEENDPFPCTLDLRMRRPEARKKRWT